VGQRWDASADGSHIELKQLPPLPPSADQGEGKRWSSGSALEVVHDQNGNALGGIQLAQHAVPTATNTDRMKGEEAAERGIAI